jgi:hypothetical protein
MEGNGWGSVVEGDPLSGSVSLPSVVSPGPRVRFPSTDSGGGLDLIMDSSKACSARERKNVAPSLRSGRWGCELEIGGKDVKDASPVLAWSRLGVGATEDAIAGMI